MCQALEDAVVRIVLTKPEWLAVPANDNVYCPLHLQIQ